MRVKLEDVCVKGSSNLKQSDVAGQTGEYPIYGASGYICNANFYHQEKPYVAIVKDGAGIGRTTLYPAKSSVIGTMQYLLPKESVLPEYLCYVVRYMHLEKYFTGATIPHIYYKDYKNEEFNLDKIEKQKEIVEVLGKLENIIKKRRKELIQLENLIKSRFVEMFGDPEINPMGWEQVILSDVCSSIVRGPFGSALKKEFFVGPDVDTYKVYEQKHAIQKSATIGNYYVNKEKYEELRRFECVPGDILMSCSGTMGEMYQLPEGCEKGIINQALCKFTLNDRILPICFLVYMEQTIGNLETKGSGIKNIAAVSYVKQMPINLPPMEVQIEFADFVHQVTKLKFEVQKSLDETQILMDSLMQEYFG